MPKLTATLSRCLPRCKKSKAAALVFIMALSLGVSHTDTKAIEGSYRFVSQTDGWKFLNDLKEGKTTSAQSKLQNSHDRVAIKLFYWWQYKNGATSENFTKVSSFIRNHPHWPSQKEMQRTAEAKMPSDYSPHKAIEWYSTYAPQTSKGALMYLTAIQSTKPTIDISEKVKTYWTTISMGNVDQDLFYKKYKKHLNHDLNKKRLDMLLFSDKYTEGKALAKIMGKGYDKLANARIALSAKKAGVDGLIAKVPSNLNREAGLQYERLKWRRQKGNTEGAIAILSTAPKAHEINNAKDWWRERHIVIRRLLEQKQYQRAYMLAKGHRQIDGFSKVQADWLQGWIGLKYANKSQEALQIFQVMHQDVETPISKSRAAFWAARSAEAMGSKALANSWDKKAALHAETFYGQLASKNVNGVVKAGFTSSDMKRSKLAGRSKDFGNIYKDLRVAADYLDKADLRSLASTFRRHTMWQLVENHGEAAAFHYIEEMAEQGLWRDALKNTKYLHRKGLTFNPEVLFPNIDFNLPGKDMDLVNALVRQESMFDIRAKSPAGARGLMQLMPATAKEVAKQAKLKHKTSWLTTKPEHNVKLGSNYIHRLLNKYDGQRELAIAAYNAGPGRVDRWLKMFGDPRTGEISMIDWIEHIPVYETRNYVQRVTENYNVYKAIKRKV